MKRRPCSDSSLENKLKKKSIHSNKEKYSQYEHSPNETESLTVNEKSD